MNIIRNVSSILALGVVFAAGPLGLRDLRALQQAPGSPLMAVRSHQLTMPEWRRRILPWRAWRTPAGEQARRSPVTAVPSHQLTMPEWRRRILPWRAWRTPAGEQARRSPVMVVPSDQLTMGEWKRRLLPRRR